MARSDERVLAAFGEILRAERNKLGWSQERLAEASDLHRVYISELERGLRNPSVLAFMRIARALGLKPSELLQKFDGR